MPRQGKAAGKSSGEAQGTRVSPATFFEIVDEVLVSSGRDRLKPGAPPRRIITVEPSDRVLQILAGPGSGKTEMLVWRVLFDLLVRGVPSSGVMVTTFTRRAATELEVRVVERCDRFLQCARKRGVDLKDPHVHDLRIGTIHSLCDALLAEFDTKHVAAGTQVIDEMERTVRLARDYRWELGYTEPPVKRVVNRLLETQALVALFRSPWEDDASWPRSTMDRVSFLGDVLAQQVETWLPRCGAQGAPNGVEIVHARAGLTDDLKKLAQRWEEYLDKNHILDFATIQKRFLENHSAIPDEIRHVFVDEFQDTNPIQFAIHTNWLKRPKLRLTVVGDDDQAIYRFRGSDIGCFNTLEPFCNSKGDMTERCGSA